MSEQIKRYFAGNHTLVVYQMPNGTHAAEIYASKEEVDKAVLGWRGVWWEEVCRLENMAETAKQPVDDFLKIIDHVNREPRMAEVLRLWLNAL